MNVKTKKILSIIVDCFFIGVGVLTLPLSQIPKLVNVQWGLGVAGGFLIAIWLRLLVLEFKKPIVTN
jgi:hypothetical protein